MSTEPALEMMPPFAVENGTGANPVAQAIAVSEMRYRRLFETAQDAILILDAATGKIFDANPYLMALLGYTHDELVGKELWEIGLFHDRNANRAAMRQLQEQGYIRYDDLPLETKNGQRKDVEFVSNVYDVDGQSVIQCNIRDIPSASGPKKHSRKSITSRMTSWPCWPTSCAIRSLPSTAPFECCG